MEKQISVTEASRNFAECVNRVRYQNMTYILVKNGTPVARLAPEKKAATGAAIAAAIEKAPLPEAEARAWRKDLRRARRSVKTPADKWR